jgi:hypothetical protein
LKNNFLASVFRMKIKKNEILLCYLCKGIKLYKPILKMNYQAECEYCSRQLTDEDGRNYCNDCLYSDNDNMENIIRGVLQVPPQPNLERRNCDLAVPAQTCLLPNIEARRSPNVNDMLFSYQGMCHISSTDYNDDHVPELLEECNMFGFDDYILPELDKNEMLGILKKNDYHDFELNLDDKSESEEYEEIDLHLDFPRVPLERSEPIRPPLRLRRNEDLYRLISNEGEIIKSWITDKEVPNYVYDEIQERIIKIDPFQDDEDRRLLLENCELAENY